MNNIKWIFFDMGGVILNDDEAETRRQQALLSIVKPLDATITIAKIQKTWWEASKTVGSIWKNTLRLLLPNHKQINVLETKFLEIVPNGTYASTSFIRPEAKNVLGHLNTKYNLGIIANQSTSITEKLIQTDILKYFSHQKVSAHHGLEKPDPAYFASVLSDTGADPNTSALIDDNWPRGLLPAKKLGMTTVLYKRDIWKYSDTQPDYSIYNLAKLIKVF